MTKRNISAEEMRKLRNEALEKAVGNIVKTYGEGAIMRLGEDTRLDVPAISTGSIALDAVLGVGGIPRGRITEIFGPESSGKTTLSLHIIAEAQKKGGLAAFVDAEHALDPKYAAAIGVDVDNLWVAQPDSGEQALEIAEQLVRSMAVDVVVVDSVAALVPKAEIEGNMGDAHVGLQARLMSQALRKLTGVVSKSMTSLVFINQTRMKIGSFYGPSETTTGGTALKFYSTVRLKINRTGGVKSQDSDIGAMTRVRVVKNKVAPPFREATFEIIYGEGISRTGELLEIGSELGIVEKKGVWFSYKGERLGQGRENAKDFLKKNPDLAKEIETTVRQELGLLPKEQKAPQSEK